MIDDRLREAARDLRRAVPSEAPPLGRRHHRPVALLVSCAVLFLGGLWAVRADWRRPTPTPPAVSAITTVPPNTTAPVAIVPVVPCAQQAAPPPQPPDPGSGTVVDTTPPDGGYVRPDGALLCGAERTAVIEGLLADVPVPVGFEVPSYGTTGPDWRSLVYEVSSSVVCAWLDEWFIAQAAGDLAGMTTAATALDTATTWEMLNRDFVAWHAEHVKTWADAVNGRGAIGTGNGGVPPTRELAESALVCRWRHR